MGYIYNKKIKYKIKNIIKKQAYINLYNKVYIQSLEYSSLASLEESSFETLNDSSDKLRFAIVGVGTNKLKTSISNLSLLFAVL